MAISFCGEAAVTLSSEVVVAGQAASLEVPAGEDYPCPTVEPQKKRKKESLQRLLQVHHQKTERNLHGRRTRQLCHDAPESESAFPLAELSFDLIANRFVGRRLFSVC